MKRTIIELKRKLERDGTGQGFGTYEILSHEHLSRWVTRHSNIPVKHIEYLVGVIKLDDVINGNGR